MKFRSLAFLLPLGGVITFSFSAQGQAPSNEKSTLQIQDNFAPSPAATPTASPATPTPSPEATAPAAQASATPAASPAAESAATTPTNPVASTNPPAPAATTEPAAPASNSGAGSPGENPPPSDPNSLIPPPTEPAQPSPINSAGNEEKQRQEQKARYYAVKVKADKDEELISLQNKADKAKNEEAKRQALRQYYDLLAKRMKKLDPSLTDWINTMHSAYLRRLEQVRLEPTIPVNPPPTPAASPSPSPSPSGTPHHKRKKQVEE